MKIVFWLAVTFSVLLAALTAQAIFFNNTETLHQILQFVEYARSWRFWRLPAARQHVGSWALTCDT